MAKVCIVLATYNGEKYLPQMLDSLLAQTRPADIIVAVDDGSKDSSVKILQDYAQKLPLQIHALPQNTGHRAAFSKALELARTQLGDDDLIALADQDDIWHPQKIEVLEMKIRDRDLVFGDAQVIDADGKTIANSWREMDRIPKHLSVKALLTGFTNVTGCMALFKAGLLANVLPIPDGVPVHDQWITLCAAVRGGYAPVSDKVIRYRIHGENAIGGAGGHSWTEKLRTNLQWAKAVHDSTLYARLNEDQKKFLDGYIAYMDARFQSALLPGRLPWLVRNSHYINPHVHGIFAHLTHAAFGSVGVKFATRFLGKK